MKEKKEMVSVRLPKNERDEIKIWAKEKRRTMSEMLCQIIRQYREQGSESNESYIDLLKRIGTVVNNLSYGMTKIAGSAERTEAFIKTLLSQDRSAVPSVMDDSADSTVSTSGYDDSMVSALSALLGRLLDRATRTKNFDGTQAMQIRISMDEFARIQNQYEQACTLRNS